MGIKGLWSILKPVSEKLTDQSRLKGHRLAVDVSIWMYQLSKALPPSKSTSSGYNPLVLAGLVKRILKLLHFGIRPVLVFDGGVPLLKAATIKERRSRRAEAESRYKRLAKKMLKLRMGMVALGAADTTPKVSEPAIPEVVVKEESYSSSESELEDFEYEVLEGLDIDSPDFKSLPLDLRQELLLALKEHTLRTQLGRAAAFSNPADAFLFSHAQIDALVKRRKIAGELERASRSTFGAYGRGSGEDGRVGHRIASSSTREFELVKSGNGGWTFTDKTESKAEKASKAAINVGDEEEDDFDAKFFECEENRADEMPSGKAELMKDIPSESSILQEETLHFVPPESAVPPALESTETEESEPIHERFEEASEAEELPSLEEIIALRISLPTKEPPIPSDHEELEVLIESMAEPLPSIVPSPSIEEWVEGDVEEEDFLDEYQFTSREDLLNRFEASISETHAGLRAAQNESGSLENELLSDFQRFLTLLGLPWLISPMEAEAQCAWLQAAGLVDGIITDDSDVFAFAPEDSSLLVYRHFFKAKSPVLVYGMPQIEFQLGLKRGDFVALALLLGADYGVGVRGIGPKRGSELVGLLKQTMSMQKFQGDEAKYCLSMMTMLRELVEDFDRIGADLELEDQKKLEKITSQIHHLEETFPSPAIIQAYLRPRISEDRRPFVWNTPNGPQLERFLAGHLKWNAATFKAHLGPILKTLAAKPS